MILGMLVSNPFFLKFDQLPAPKKGFKKQAALQTLGPSYFLRALEKNKGQFAQN